MGLFVGSTRREGPGLLSQSEFSLEYSVLRKRYWFFGSPAGSLGALPSWFLGNATGSSGAPLGNNTGSSVPGCCPLDGAMPPWFFGSATGFSGALLAALSKNV